MAHQPPPMARAGLLVTGVVLLQALLLVWFAWPAQKTAPRDLPVVVAGPAPAVTSLGDRLRAERPGAFEISVAADTTAADAALRDRKAYAAFVVGPDGVSVRLASAASPAVAALVSQAAQQFGGQALAPGGSGPPVRVVDVVPAPADDPRGAGFAAGFLPLLLTSLAVGAALIFAVTSRRVRLVGLLGYAMLAGLVAAAVLHGLGILSGGYLATAAVTGLLALAISAGVCGLGVAFGRVGLGLGVLLVFVVGNPISGLASAPELLPRPWGGIGQLLPPGAGAQALRSVAFFDGAAASAPLWVLTGWAVAGLVLTAVGRFRGPVRPAGPGASATG